MCGILGIISFKNIIETELSLKFPAALDLQSHRGPDNRGIFRGRNFLLGHRRLSIIDLDEKANQPMISNCGNYVIVFNGEIYNFKELKRGLEKKGYKFRTNSDTEVLLNLYIEEGIACLNKLIGMFAFCIYDGKKREFYLVRDRLGIKPLYYYKNSKEIIFSSEIKSILYLNPNLKKLNLTAVSSYMSFRYPILNDTFFEEIFSLPPAHYLRIKDEKIELKEYWSPIIFLNEQLKDKGENYYKRKLRELLASSVKYRMISDVPIGAFLSGGVDSSVVSVLMALNSSTPIKTFTIGFKEEKDFNEFYYSRLIASRYNTQHYEIILSGKDYLKNLEKLISYKDAPLSVPNEVPLYLMSRELKKYITVVLSGEGADEIFGGYGRIFRSPYDWERFKHLESLKWPLKIKKAFLDKFYNKYGYNEYKNEIDHFLYLYRYTSFSEKKELLSEDVNLELIEKKLIDKFSFYFKKLSEIDYYNKIMYVFEKIHLVGLLHRVDTTTMATSVEARVPFVDHRLVEFAFTIPFKYKLKWKDKISEEKKNILMSDELSEVYDIPKYILKKSFEDLLPQEILYRRKMGFPVPLHSWLGGKFRDYVKEVLLSPKAIRRGIYNVSGIEKWLKDEELEKSHSKAMKIWMLLNLELFLNKYFN